MLLSVHLSLNWTCGRIKHLWNSFLFFLFFRSIFNIVMISVYLFSCYIVVCMSVMFWNQLVFLTKDNIHFVSVQTIFLNIIEDGSPGVRYPRESRPNHMCTHHHTNTHMGRITPGVDTQHTIKGHHHWWAPTTATFSPSASAQRRDKHDN